MYEVICYDSDGNSINYLTQWDLNRVLYIPLIEYSTMLNNAEVHFCNNKTEEALVQSTIVENGDTLIVSVPNELLQSSYPLIGHIYLTSPSANSFGTTTQKTVITFTLPVNERTRPSDYIYDDNGNTNTKSESYDLVMTVKQDSFNLSGLQASQINIISGSLLNVYTKSKESEGSYVINMPRVLLKYVWTEDSGDGATYYYEPSVYCRYSYSTKNIYMKVNWFDTNSSFTEHSFVICSDGTNNIELNRITKVTHTK